MNRLALRRSLKPVKIGLVLAAFLAAASVTINILLARPILEGLMPIAIGTVAGGAATIGLLLWIRWQAKKVYRESASLQEEMTLVFEADGFRIEQESGLWRVRWEQLVRWDEDRSVFLLFPNRALAIILPKAQVCENVVDYVRRQMKISGLERAWRLRK
jgi:hypothetical protein